MTALEPASDTPAPEAARWLSTTEAAERCGVSAETIRRWIRTKGLPAYNTRLGLNIRIRLSDLQAFARQHNILFTEPPPPSTS